MAQIQIQIPNKYLGFGYKGLVFCRNNGWSHRKHGQGTYSTKMGSDKLAKNTLNVPEPKILTQLYPKMILRTPQPKSSSRI